MVELLSHPFFAIVFFLGILIFIHEFGHFIVGKAFGIGVETFSIGFGPPLLKFRHKETDYQLSWLPLGGFVKFAGAIETEEVPLPLKGKEFYKASYFAQISTIFAGPFFNLLLAAFVYGMLGAKGIEHPAPIIGQIRHGSPAAHVGLQVGDKIMFVNGAAIISWQDLQEQISSSPDHDIHLQIQREGRLLQFDVKPESVNLEDMAGRNRKQGRIGIGYGFLPPYLEILPRGTPARDAGVEAGSEVKKLIFAKQDISITRWDEFLKALASAFESGVDSITIELIHPKTKLIERKVLKTIAWSKGSNAKLTVDDPESLAKALGITDSQMTIGTVESDPLNPLKPGDRILSFEGRELKDIYDLSELLQKNDKEQVQFSIQRADEVVNVSVKLKAVEIQKASGKAIAYMLPVSFLGDFVAPPPVLEIYPNLIDNIKFAVRTTWVQSYTLVSVVGGLFSGQVPLKILGGPIFIAKVAGDSAKMGMQTFFMTLALLSINLGVLNFLPIPALDGGKLFILFVETVFRRRMSISFIENFQKIGFIMLLSLMVLATYNDLSRFWSSILRSLMGTLK
jgi:regulator of sigma E protease